jgi:hypothetical protein
MTRALPIPDAALDDRLAFVGTAGSGKTYNASSGVERLLERRARAVIVDPLGVWYGLRLLADGKSKGFDVAIFGGAHGDLPLTEHAGALIGETAAGMAESCIVDLSQIGTKAGERRFMLAFLTALYRNATKEPLHLIVDEADMFAPQRLMDKDGDAARLLGMMETIVRRGRVKGFIPWLITQRPAVLSKDVLSQADGMVAFKLTASQDRAAIGAWIEGQADQQQGKAILASLPSMQRGEGVVWVPGRGILETASFPEKRTFDSSRTPKRGETVRAAALKPLDLGALKDRLAVIEIETKANDPKALKAEVAKLTRELAAKPAGTPATDPRALADAERIGYERGLAEGLARGESRAKAALQAVQNRISDAAGAIAASIQSLDSPMPAPLIRRATAVPPPASPRAQVPQAPASPSDVALGKAERRALTALAQYPEGRTKNQVAILAGYAVNGGGFNNALSAARTAGRVVGAGDRLQITDQGLADLGPFDPLPHGDELLQHWLGQLGKAEKSALLALVQAYPNPMTKEQIAAEAGYEPNGGGFNNALSRLRSLELIEGRGEIVASGALFG